MLNLESPGARLIFNNPWEIMDYLNSLINHAQAYRETSNRLNDAHDYVQKYCMPQGWGQNVWHTILDDAIKMRLNHDS